MLCVAGAGMAGLVASARLRQLGVAHALVEKGDRVGGSMLLSSGVVWRYRTFDEFRAQCPDGNERLQRLVWERLDEAFEWLGRLVDSVAHTSNPLNVGRRFDPRSLTDALARAATDVQHRAPFDGDGPVILATGGFHASADLVAKHVGPAAPLGLRGNRWSTGDGLRFALARGASLSGGMDEFYGRNMPDRPLREDEYVSASQLYAARARVVDEGGDEFLPGSVTWSETEVVQATARQRRARAWYLLDQPTLHDVRNAVELSRTAVPAAELPFAVPRNVAVGVHVRAAVTHTIGGVVIDERTRVVGADGVWAAGVDAGGISTGGYASGLAQALVLGLVAAEDVAR